MSAIALLCATLGAFAPGPIELPQGVTKLTDIGFHRVGYVYDDGRKGQMPLGWTGHFHGPTGISYTSHGQQDGRECLLMHCIWRGGSGITHAEYDLKLPDVKPIRLELAVAMRTDVATPDRSDGADFRVSVQAADRKRVLVDEHYAKAKWKPLSFDLSQYAGETIVLRLETGPGPNNNSGWDYSYVGDPRIVVGEAKASKDGKPLWPMQTDLARLHNARDRGACPTGPAPANARLTAGTDRGQVDLQADWPACKGKVRYELQVRDDKKRTNPALADLWVTVVGPDGKPTSPIKAGLGSGIILTDGKKRWAADSNEVKVRLLSEWPPKAMPAAGKPLIIETEHVAGPVKARVVREIRMIDSCLAVRIRSKDTHIAEVHFGGITASLRKVIQVPYLGLGPVWYLPQSQLYASIVLDWTKSNATRHDQTSAYYEAKTDGSRNPVDTTAYFTFSPRLADVLCNIPNPPSPFLTDLSDRIVFDVWGGNFRDDAEWFDEMALYGVRDAALIKHVWQRSGYDNALPNHIPANPKMGGDDDMKHYVKTTRDLGYRASLHENYVDFYPNSELYDPNDVSLNAEGELIKAWFNAGTGIQSFAFKPTAIMQYARMQSPEIHKRYGTNAAYLDVHTCVPPWFHVDHRAGEPGAATFKAVWDVHRELFAFERATHEGPLFGEGNNHFFWAGHCDGCEAQVVTGEDAPWLVDFDLLKIHPQMVNHGMGYIERWLTSGYGEGWYSRVPLTIQMDKYRAMELAFGHAGFVPQQIWHHLPYVLREFYLVTPIQKRYVTAKPRKILYDVGGRMLAASQAVAAGPLSNRVYVEYDSGLKLWCNGSEEDWKIPAGVLCQYGFRAEAAGLEVTTTRFPTAEGKSVVADYREADGILYADARGFEPELRAGSVDVEPGVKAFDAIGPRQFRITYQWKVGHAEDKEWRCFVHFVNPKMHGPDHIAFQNDHALPKSTAKWKPGEAIVDGPHEVTIPDAIADGTYEIAIGLFGEMGRAILPFKNDGRGRYLIGAVTLRDGTVSFAKKSPERLSDAAQDLYVAHRNIDRAMVDFGKVVTNGCVAIKPAFKSWWVTIYPKEKPFTIRLRMDRLQPDAPPGEWKVQSLNNNKRSYGPLPITVEGNAIEWETGQDRVIYYCVSQ